MLMRQKFLASIFWKEKERKIKLKGKKTSKKSVNEDFYVTKPRETTQDDIMSNNLKEDDNSNKG